MKGLTISMIGLLLMTGCGAGQSDADAQKEDSFSAESDQEIKGNGESESLAVSEDSVANVDTIPSEETVDEEPVDEDAAWYNSPQSNGYSFAITQECLDRYLTYVVTEEARDTYIEHQKKKDSYPDGDFQYFTIAGMYQENPYLILSSVNDDTCSDEVSFFVTMEGDDEIYLMDIFSEDYDNLSMVQTVVSNQLYVVTEEFSDQSMFMERVHTEYNSSAAALSESYVNTNWSYRYKDGEYTEQVEVMNDGVATADNMLGRKQLAELKWFGLDQVEEARAYYSQFAEADEGEDASDRQVYFEDDSCALGFFDYFESGEFELTTEFNETVYQFTGISGEDKQSLRSADIGSDVQFYGGADTCDRQIDVFLEGDGYLFVERATYIGNGGSGFKVYQTRDAEMGLTWINLLGNMEYYESIEDAINSKLNK